jgi:hypothetical protein
MIPAHILYVDKYELHQSVFQTLHQSCPYPPLLPNLRHLGIDSHHVDTTSGYDAYVASLFTSFSPKLLQSLQIECGLESNDTLYLLTQLPKHCAQIEFLYVSLLGRTLLLDPFTKFEGVSR